MRSKRTILTTTACLTLGLILLVFVIAAANEQELHIYGPSNEPSPPSGKKIAVAPNPSGAEEGGDAQSNTQIMAPIGSVVAWLKSYTNTPSLSPQWVECNGQRLSLAGSPYDGATLPNLNGANNEAKRFLRGSGQSGATGGADSHNHGFYLIDRPKNRVVNVAGNAEASSLPSYYEVTWIMRVL